MLPKIREQVNFKVDDIVISDETIRYIVSTQHLSHKEDNVRNALMIFDKMGLEDIKKVRQDLLSRPAKTPSEDRLNLKCLDQ